MRKYCPICRAEFTKEQLNDNDIYFICPNCHNEIDIVDMVEEEEDYFENS